ncbi:MAG: thiH [Candidatus Brocadiaceae bacterium]|nr:thiH [Candidatus Brocadiaceae bacterium]
MTFIDENNLHAILENTAKPPASAVAGILEKGRRLEGLSPEEAFLLINTADQDAGKAIVETASYIKNAIYGDRLVFFAPFYLSNYCVNDCDYCGFHASNKSPRKKLTMDEIREQVGFLIDMGHKRLLLELGEDPDNNSIDYLLEAIDAIYSVKSGKGEIRRVNVNIAATTVGNYKLLKSKGIGTYQLFQETYHRETYEAIHKGPKSSYERQLYAMNNAFEAGIDDVGLGALFGLYDWRFEVLALIAHARFLANTFGVGPHTISVPRFRPASTVEMLPTHPVSDDDFLKLIAILRIAVPYTGMIITTRERPEIREITFRTGITQASAASSTAPGGFGKKHSKESQQFELADKRSLDEIAVSVMNQGFTPSFCTACYRKSRTGNAFMDLAKPGDIKEFCQPNSILTLMEYLEDNASLESRTIGLDMIKKSLSEIDNAIIRKRTEERLERIKHGERDLYF